MMCGRRLFLMVALAAAGLPADDATGSDRWQSRPGIAQAVPSSDRSGPGEFRSSEPASDGETGPTRSEPTEATQSSDPWEVRWQAVVPDSDGAGPVALADGRTLDLVLVRSVGDLPMKIACDGDVRPARYAVRSGFLITGAFSEPTRTGTSEWIFPPAPSALDLWALHAPGCTPYIVARRGTARGLARLERQVEDPGALPRAVRAAGIFGEAQAWLDEAPSIEAWWGRYGALRPADTVGMGSVPLRSVDQSVEVRWSPTGEELPPHQTSVWRHADEGLRWEIDGPVRIQIHARVLEPFGEICLEVDGESHCQHSVPAVRYRINDGALLREPLRYKDKRVGQTIRWQAALAPGPHKIRLPHPALVRAFRNDLFAYYRGSVPPPSKNVVFPPSFGRNPSSGTLRLDTDEVLGLETDAGPDSVTDARPKVKSEDGTVVPTLVSWRPNGPVDAETPRWVPPSDLVPLPLTSWIDEEGRTSIWFQSQNEVCTVKFGNGQIFRAKVEDLFQQFLWTGPTGQEPMSPPSSDCPALVRVAHPPPGLLSDDARVISPFDRLEARQQVRYALDPHVPVELSISLEWAQIDPVVLSISDGATWSDRLVLQAAGVTAADAAQDREGRTWRSAVHLPIDAGRRELRVSASATVLVRVALSQIPPETNALSGRAGRPGQVEPGPVVSLSSPPPVGPPEPTIEDKLRAIQELSCKVAAASDPTARAAGLVARAGLLDALDQETMALRDLRWAEFLAPGSVDPLQVARRVARSRARVLYGDNRWVSASGGWLHGPGTSPEADAPLLKHAADGDFLELARFCRTLEADTTCRDQTLAYWRRAIVTGLPLTDSDRVLAYVDLVRLGTHEQREAEDLRPLRWPSRWERILQARGDVRAATPGRSWDTDRDSEGDALELALFPDRWPEEWVVGFAPGREVALPPRQAGLSIGVRCRSTGLTPPSGPCIFSAVDDRGTLLYQVEADPYGRESLLEVPPTRSIAYIRVTPDTGFVSQLRLPPDLAGPLNAPTTRTVWRVEAGRDITLDVLGPTVVRFFAEGTTPETSTPGLRVWLNDVPFSEGPDPTPVDGRGLLEVPILREGPVTVRLQLTKPARVAAWMRVPSSRPLPGEQTLDPVAATMTDIGQPGWNRFNPADGFVDTEDLTTGGGPNAPDVPAAPDNREDGAPAEDSARVTPISQALPVTRARPSQSPAGTVFGSLRLGREELDEEEWQDLQWRAEAGAGLTSRPGNSPWWGALELSATATTGQSPLFRPRAGFDWYPIRGRRELALFADLNTAAGHQGDALLVTGDARVRAELRQWLTPQWRLSGQLRYLERHVLAGSYARELAADTSPLLWSEYRANHPRSFFVGAELRGRLGSWIFPELDGWVESNATLSTAPVDCTAGRFQVRVALPALEMTVGSRLDRRLQDADRVDGYWSAEVWGRASLWLWPRGTLGTRVFTQISYRSHFSETIALLGLELFASRDRALEDIRPSRLFGRQAAEWFQDRAADRQYGVYP